MVTKPFVLTTTLEASVTTQGVATKGHRVATKGSTEYVAPRKNFRDLTPSLFDRFCINETSPNDFLLKLKLKL